MEYAKTLKNYAILKFLISRESKIKYSIYTMYILDYNETKCNNPRAIISRVSLKEK